jgi:hypothetical protein
MGMSLVEQVGYGICDGFDRTLFVVQSEYGHNTSLVEQVGGVYIHGMQGTSLVGHLILHAIGTCQAYFVNPGQVTRESFNSFTGDLLRDPLLQPRTGLYQGLNLNHRNWGRGCTKAHFWQ